MQPAKYETTSVKISAGKYRFTVAASKIVFQGFRLVYTEAGEEKEEKSVLMKGLDMDSKLTKESFDTKQHFTQPPAHYTEATLVKALEELGIGRPSTYAPIVATLMDRKYVTKDKKSLMPTELGFIVIDMMQQYFKEIVDTGFTAQMEENLDDIEAKGVRWKSVIEDFYGGFKKELDVAEKEITVA